MGRGGDRSRLLALALGLAGAGLAPAPAALAQAPAVGQGDPEAERPVTPAPPLPERPEALVRAIYQAEDRRGQNASPLDWTAPETARRLFVPSLAALAIADGRRAVPDRRLPFDPFTGALQERPGQVGVRVVSATADRAEVAALFTVSRAVRTVGYRLVRGADGWRIADIWWGDDRRRSFARLLQ